jgi:hypothetical protein
MALEEFKTCAAKSLGDQVDAWDEVVVQNLIEVGRWFKSLDSTVQYVFGGILAAAGASAVALLAKAVGMAAAEVALPVIAAFAVGVGIGAGLIVVVECADEAAM